MKVTGVLADRAGCGYIRMLVPLAELAAKGHAVRVSDRLGPQFFDSDIVIVQRSQSQEMCDQIIAARKAGARVLYETDDNLFSLPPDNPGHQHYGKRSVHVLMRKVLDACDGVICSTDRLASEMERYNPNVFVAKNALDRREIADYLGFDGPTDTDEIRVGWAGTNTHHADFLQMARGIVDVMKARPQMALEFIGWDWSYMFPPELRSRIRSLGSTFDDDKELPTRRYYRKIAQAQWHLAIAPLNHVVFNSSKSYLKLMEYGALGVPAIAENFGPYREYANLQKENVVLLADSPKVWAARLLWLIDDANMRAQLRRANRENVLKQHLIETRISAWEAAFSAVLEKAA